MRGKFNKKKNKVFLSIITLSVLILTLFIISALTLILIRGLPKLKDSLFIREIQFPLKLSLITASISTSLCILFAVPTAYGLSRFDFPGKKIINIILDIPMSLPPIVSGVALLLFFGNTAFGRFLTENGLRFVFTVRGIIVAQFFINIPFILRVLRSTFLEIDPKLEFVSRTLGFNQFKTFFKVTLPLAKNGLIAGIVITWARALGEFGATLMLAGATRMKTETLPISLFLNMSTGDLDLAFSSASVIIIISLISLFIFELLTENPFIKVKEKK